MRGYLNNEFAHELTDGHTGELQTTVTDLTAMDGTTDYGHSADKVTLLTVDQCRKYRYIRPLSNVAEWTVTADTTPSTPNTGDTGNAWNLGTNGGLGNSYCTSAGGARPAFTLPSDLVVKVDSEEHLAAYSDADLLAELLKRRRDNE